MQSSLPFSWGQVAKRIFNHVDTVRVASLKEKFNLFADPCIFALIQDSETNDRLRRVCNQIGANVVSCEDFESTMLRLSNSPVLAPTVCVVDKTVGPQGLEQIQKALERHFSSTIFQLTTEIETADVNASTDMGALKQIELPIDKDAFASTFNEFLIKASQLTGHLRRIKKLDSLNEREKILVQLISFGVPNKSSASILKLAEKTVEKCRTGVYRKLDVRSTGELASLVTMANFYRWPKGVEYPPSASA